MRDSYKVIVGSLAGAAAIHAALAACGGIGNMMGDGAKDARADNDSGGSCGCTNGPVQTVPASENPAQLRRGISPNSDGEGPFVAGAIVVEGPFVLTDATVFPSSTSTNAGNSALYIQPMASNCILNPENDGGSQNPGTLGNPNFVTEVISAPNYSTDANEWFWANHAVHGARYLIPAGSMLCSYGPEIAWAGFRPY